MKALVLPPRHHAERFSEQRRLTNKEARLIEAIFEGERNGTHLTLTEAGIRAGYTGGRESARVSASRALQRPEVQRALRQRVEAEFLVAAPSAFKALADLSVSGKSEYCPSSKHLGRLSL